MSARRNTRASRAGRDESPPPAETRQTPEEISRPAGARRAARTDDASAGPQGWRASKRSSKLGRQLRREAKTERLKQQVNQGVRTAKSGAIGSLQIAGIAIAGLLVTALVAWGLAVGINAGARWLAKREADEAASPEAQAKVARENLLVIGASGTSSAEFLAVRLDKDGEQVLGIAIPSGAFMEVPGQGFERVGDSYAAGPEVSLSAISNYLTVPFDRYVIVDVAVYQDAVTNQSLRDVMPNVQSTNLSDKERDDVAAFIEGVESERTAIVPLPVKPIDLGGQTFFEPQREEVADLLLQWWGVKLGAEDDTLRVIVYNGAGSPGIAGDAAQELIAAGMKVVDTKNADRFDYDTTLIVVQDGDLAQGDLVKSTLRVGQVIDQPAEQDVADVIVIIGRDYVPAASGS